VPTGAGAPRTRQGANRGLRSGGWSVPVAVALAAGCAAAGMCERGGRHARGRTGPPLGAVGRLVVALASLLLVGCSPPTPAVTCAGPPDADLLLAQAWAAYQPDQPMSPAIRVRRHLFAFQALLISAGMYGDAPADPARVYADYAPQFVRDFGRGRNDGMREALDRLTGTLLEVREQADSELADRCGLLLARRALRADAQATSVDWVMQVVTGGFAPHFQASIEQLVRRYATACASEPDASAAAEALLGCLTRRVGL
jgi:hypothetical protein